MNQKMVTPIPITAAYRLLWTPLLQTTSTLPGCEAKTQGNMPSVLQRHTAVHLLRRSMAE